MDISKIRKWVRPMEDTKVNLDNTWGNKQILQIMKGSVPDAEKVGRALFHLPEQKCFFYYGPEGSGKQQMAVAFAGTMREQAGYECYTVRNASLSMATMDDITNVVDEVIKAAGEKNTFFYLENPGKNKNTKLLLDCMMEEIVHHSSLHLVFVVSDSDLRAIRSEWQSRMVVCRFELPNLEERLLFLQGENTRLAKKQTGEIVERDCIPIPKVLGCEYLAQQTEGFSYPQMKLLMDKLKLKMNQKAIHAYQDSRNAIYKAILEEEFACTRAEIDDMIADVRQVAEDQKKQRLGDQELKELLQQLMEFLQSRQIPNLDQFDETYVEVELEKRVVQSSAQGTDDEEYYYRDKQLQELLQYEMR